MTQALMEPKTNGGAVLAEIDPDTLSKLILNGDLSQLSPSQKTAYYVYRCKAAGLDPATKPLELLKLNGKEVLYATKECSAQISQREQLSVTVQSDGAIGDIYRVVARATSPDGRCTDDMGCVNIKGQSGDALCNAMMKATTKAKRRAILTHAGLGMLDESELETIKDVRPAAARAGVAVKVVEGSGEVQHRETPIAEATPPAAPSSVEPTVIVPDVSPVAIKKVIEKLGKKKSGEAFTRYGILIQPEGGEEYWTNTFSKTLGDTAKKCLDNGLKALIRTERDGDWTNLAEIQAVEA
jgi:hypothetical protein